MIKLRSRPPKPRTLKSAKVSATKRDLARKIAGGEGLRSQDFPPHWSAEGVKQALWDFQRGKCCYCERKRDMKRESDVEHFRPKAKVTGVPDHPGYWWLAYEWDNYFLSCKGCNSDCKCNHFPLLDTDSRACKPGDPTDSEQPVLINPETENPEDFIGFEWSEAWGMLVKAWGRDPEQRGKRTIDLLGLNRQSLLEERAELVETLNAIVREMHAGQQLGCAMFVRSAAKRIREETSSKRQFSGFRRHFFRAAGLAEYIADD